MNAKQYGVGLMLAGAALVSGCATTLDNSARTVGNIATIPYKIGESAVTQYNPIQGVKDGALDTLEQLGRTIAVQPTDRHPAERGEVSQYIAERPLLNAATNVATAGGVGFGVADWVGAHAPHIWQTAAYAGAGQAVVEGLNTVLK